MDQFFEMNNLSKVTQEEIDDSNRTISIKEIEAIIKNLPKQQEPDPDEFMGELYQMFRLEIIPKL